MLRKRSHEDRARSFSHNVLAAEAARAFFKARAVIKPAIGIGGKIRIFRIDHKSAKVIAAVGDRTCTGEYVFGDRQLRQIGAVRKRLVSDDAKLFREVHIRQPASGKCSRFKLLRALINGICPGFSAGALHKLLHLGVIQHALRVGFKIFVFRIDNKSREARATGKRIGLEPPQPGRNENLLQTRAALKCAIVNGRNTRRQLDSLKTRAAFERVLPNVRNIHRQLDSLKLRAARKRIMLD